MVTYLGNQIKLSSNRLSYCLFQSNWIEQSKPTRKCIITLTEVLKQPQVLVIWKLYPLDLQTFTSVSLSLIWCHLSILPMFDVLQILKFAYSMLNILRNLDWK